MCKLPITNLRTFFLSESAVQYHHNDRNGVQHLWQDKKKRGNEKGQAIAKLIMEQYQPQNKEEMQDAIKDVFGPMLEAMLQGEMDNHLNDHGSKDTDNRRNGYIGKTVRSSFGEIPVSVPRDRDGSFEPQVIPKRSKDITGIEDKVLSMYGRGISQRDISSTIEDIYGFSLSAESISNITDRVLEEAEVWQNCPLKSFYPFIFVDCLYVPIRQEYETKNCAIYVILGYDLDGIKDSLGLWISDTEGKHNWMQIFDEIKTRGVEDVAFISMDVVSGLYEGAQFFHRWWYNAALCTSSAILLSISPPRIIKDLQPSLKRFMVLLISKRLFPNLTALRKLGNIILEQWPYGRETGYIWNSFSIMVVPYAV